MKKLLFILFIASLALSVNAQPAARRTTSGNGTGDKKQTTESKSNANNLTTRAQLSYPTAVNMSEDVVWRRDIYRVIDLKEKENSGLYYPVEAVGDKQNLFTYIFKLMLTGKIKVYEYRLDGNEVFNDSARIKPLEFLKNYEIYYTLNDKRLHIDNSDIPSRKVTSYYIKESAYYDQANATFHKKCLALCPIMKRQDEFGDYENSYPLFWVKYDDLAPFLAKQTIMTSDVNNAATMSLDDYFTRTQYKGKIYKTNNMLGRALAEYCDTESKMSAEQARIEKEISDFEQTIFKSRHTEVTDSTDSVKVDEKATKSSKRSKTTEKKPASKTPSKPAKSSASKPKSSAPKSSGSSGTRVSVRRERH